MISSEIDFEKLKIKLEPKLQTFAAFFYVFAFLQGLRIIGYVLFIYLLFTNYYWLSILYAIWYYFDYNRPFMGGRVLQSTRNWKLWHYFRDYFPISLVKTTDLDPNKNYLFCVHPHGVMCFGAMANFGTEATGFSEKFPGLTPHLITLNGQFFAPLMREILMMFGSCPCDEGSLKYILNNKGRCKQKGQVCALIVGGFREATETIHNRYKLVIRKGFIRVALQTGASLIPIVSYGENDLYNILTNENRFLLFIKQTIKKLFKVNLPIIKGIYYFLPLRLPVTTVVGKPIEVQKVENPTNKQIEDLLEQYIKELEKLFNEYKDKYSTDKNAQIEYL